MRKHDDPMTPEEEVAAKRYLVMGVVRITCIAAVLVGLMIAREIVSGPYALGVALAVGGLVAFFFGPVLLAKRWKAGDRLKSDGQEE